MIARLLILSLLGQVAPDAGSIDAGPEGVAALYTRCPDAPLAEPVDGGYFVPERRAERLACQIASCEKFASEKMTENAPVPPPALIVATVGGVVVFVAGFLLGFLAPHPVTK